MIKKSRPVSCGKNIPRGERVGLSTEGFRMSIRAISGFKSLKTAERGLAGPDALHADLSDKNDYCLRLPWYTLESEKWKRVRFFLRWE